VTSDNFAGGCLAAQTLIEAGCQRIAYIAGLEDASTQRERELGFLECLRQANMQVFARTVGHYSYEGAQEAARTLCAMPVKPDAIFVANDHMAMAVMDTLRSEFGQRVPQDISVIGFDNVPQSAWPAYGLTTIAQDAQVMVQATVDLLLQAIAADLKSTPFESRTLTVPVELIRRRTVRTEGS